MGTEILENAAQEAQGEQDTPSEPGEQREQDTPGESGEQREQDTPGEPGEQREQDTPGEPGAQGEQDAQDNPLTSPHVLSDEELPGALEAILFAMGGSVEPERMAAATGRSRADVTRAIRQLQADYEQRRSGIRILDLDGHFQMCSAKEYYDTLIRIAKIPKKITLTEVMLETLSIIAYKQPVTKLEIEQIRGVKSDHAVNRLVEYGLVDELGRLEAPGRPILFGTTEEFLRHFGLSTVEDLPEIDPLRKEDFKLEAEKEIDVKLKV